MPNESHDDTYFDRLEEAMNTGLSSDSTDLAVEKAVAEVNTQSELDQEHPTQFGKLHETLLKAKNGFVSRFAQREDALERNHNEQTLLKGQLRQMLVEERRLRMEMQDLSIRDAAVTKAIRHLEDNGIR